LDEKELNENQFYSFLWDQLSMRDRLRLLRGKKRSVWLFGAGASHHYKLNIHGVNMPLARDFFKAMHRLPTAKGLHAHIGPFLSYLQSYRGVSFADASEWTEDIEEFMTSIESEIDELREKKGTLGKEERKKVIALSTVFNNMVFLFANVINEAQDGSSYSAYSELLKLCSPEDTFITFNWDTLLDKALATTGVWTPNGGYGIDFCATFDGKWKKALDSSRIFESNWELLKLHGSTNWLVPYTGLHLETLKPQGIITESDKVFLFWQASLPYETYKGRWRGGYGPTCYGYYPPNLPSDSFSTKGISTKKDHVILLASYKGIFAPFDEPNVQGLPSSPLLITPVRQKRYDYYTGTIEHMWKLAEKAFIDTDRIVAIGYSFPSTDTKIIDLIRNTLSKRKSRIELIIVDPCPESITERLGDEYLEMAKSVSIHKKNFEEFIDILWQEVPQLLKEAYEKERDVKEWIQRLKAFQSFPE
jgi:hypothetical protein